MEDLKSEIMRICCNCNNIFEKFELKLDIDDEYCCPICSDIDNFKLMNEKNVLKYIVELNQITKNLNKYLDKIKAIVRG
jgi:hypothetical protein